MRERSEAGGRENKTPVICHFFSPTVTFGDSSLIRGSLWRVRITFCFKQLFIFKFSCRNMENIVDICAFLGYIYTCENLYRNGGG